MTKEPKQKENQNTQLYTDTVEAHIIADMLRIESITTELKEFKVDTKERLGKIENWVLAIVGTTFTTLVTIVIAIGVTLAGGS
jgi:hypothetical protein